MEGETKKRQAANARGADTRGPGPPMISQNHEGAQENKIPNLLFTALRLVGHGKRLRLVGVYIFRAMPTTRLFDFPKIKNP